MYNIQDLKEKIFFESRNIINILEKIDNVDGLLSKQNLVDELAGKINFLKLLEKHIEYFTFESSSHFNNTDSQNSENELIKEEVGLNEPSKIDENQVGFFSNEVTEEEAIFNNQLNEIVEKELHERIINFVEESNAAGMNETSGDEENEFHNGFLEESTSDHRLQDINENNLSDYDHSHSLFVEEERILTNSEFENDKHKNVSSDQLTEDQLTFSNQLNELNEFENQISDDEGSLNNFDDEEEIIENRFESNMKEESPKIIETISGIFGTEALEEEILIEENEESFIASAIVIEQLEMNNDLSNVENRVSEIKNESIEEKNEASILAEINDRRKTSDLTDNNQYPSSKENFENLEEDHHDKKIRLSNIKGLKTLFDDHHSEAEKEEGNTPLIERAVKILKTNISAEHREVEKTRPEFKLDLNDRIAFSRTLFEGSQSELNEVVSTLNSFKKLEDAKEYLSDLYYEKKWNKVDEYAQRLWILVENKFL
ncbi:hypothetical protein D1631_03220 [Chryseobacterium nematophagum]|uniref:Uncharacterized protein n=1 Tax=Chryseobacterium nematophagum TaxID=2305228 RepID=A0A3M7TD98_9FLAO|nr:hypothetical protein [Chryseobacterium nematophagum]RNA61014.1 hypothetical protein D1631_03220 [Chryseobacterium nematophagum]